MAKLLFGAVLILAVCAVYSFADQDVNCDDFCNWANARNRRGEKNDKCDVSGPEVCERESHDHDKKYIEDPGNCGCCDATCITVVGAGRRCNIDNPSRYYTQCMNGRCVNGVCTDDQ